MTLASSSGSRAPSPGARPLLERPLAIRDLVGARPLSERALGINEKASGPAHPATNHVRTNLSRLLLTCGQPTEALALGESALTAHAKLLGLNHAWTKDSASVTADALDALGRTEDAKALRERYGVPSSDDSTRP
jgi:hypothetical protein